MGTVKHKFRLIVFNPANEKLYDFSIELQKLAKDAFGNRANDHRAIHKSQNATQLEEIEYQRAFGDRHK